MKKQWFTPFVGSVLVFTLVACQGQVRTEEVLSTEQKEMVEHEHNQEPEHDHGHKHSHSDEHNHEHNHGHEHEHSHAHDHNHDHNDEAQSEKEKEIYKGYFDDSEVTDRPLSNWAGKWQSVYPYLLDGTLDEVFQHKASHGDKSAEEFKEYYSIGYKTDVSHIQIIDNKVTFIKGEEATTGTYVYDGYEILTYPKGNRGVRYMFKQTDESSKAPQYIQFSDHIISDKISDHFHLYFGDDREELLKELEHWPTYYPEKLTGEQIVAEMLAH